MATESIPQGREKIPASKVRSAIIDVLLAFSENTEEGKLPIREEMRRLLETRTTNLPEFLTTLAAKEAQVERVVPEAVRKIAQYLQVTPEPDWNFLDASRETKENLSAPSASRVRTLKKVLEPELAVNGTAVLHSCLSALETVLAVLPEKTLAQIRQEMTERKLPPLNARTFEEHLRFLTERFPGISTSIQENIENVMRNEQLFAKLLPKIKSQSPTIFENILIDLKEGNRLALRNHLTGGIEALVLGELGNAREKLNTASEHEKDLKIDAKAATPISEVNKEIDRWESLINATGGLVSISSKYAPTARSRSEVV